MRAARRVITNLVALTILCAVALAQSSPAEVKHFDKEGLSFDYPTGWALTDKSNPQAQHFILTHAGSSTLIMVIAHRDRIETSDQLAVARNATTIPFAEDMSRKLGVRETAVWRNSTCTEVGEHSAVGFLLHGMSGREPTTGEIYTLVPGRRFVNLVYVRADRDDAQSNPAWRLLRDSLKVEGPKPAATDENLEEVLGAGVLNGMALELPKPGYPRDAREAGITGIVTIQVKIDESGRVYEAMAVSGPLPLRQVARQAALRAKFSPTILCGHPVKVTGVITYNFMG